MAVERRALAKEAKNLSKRRKRLAERLRGLVRREGVGGGGSATLCVGGMVAASRPSVIVVVRTEATMTASRALFACRVHRAGSVRDPRPSCGREGEAEAEAETKGEGQGESQGSA